MRPSIGQLLAMSYSHPMRVCDAADFDGTDNLERGAGLAGAVDGKKGIFSCWARIDGHASQQGLLYGVSAVGGATSRVRFRLDDGIAPSTFEVFATNAAGTTILQKTTTGTFGVGATWRHFLASWDLAAAAMHLYVNDVSDLAGGTLTDDNINYACADWGVGGTPAPTQRWDGGIAELYFAPGQYVDLSNEFWRRKFISPSGKPVHLGVDGSLATGTAPLVYLHIDDGEAVANFATNRGAGGDFTIAGTLATASSSPSD